MAMAPYNMAEAGPPPWRVHATASVSMMERIGCVFPLLESTAPLDAPVTGSTASGSLVGYRSSLFMPTIDIWSDTKTKDNVTKATRVLKMHVLKQSANTTCAFFGAACKTLSMVFTLKKLPRNLKALQIPLPHALAQTTDGLFLKTAKGKKVLSIQFGRGDMEMDVLTKNAMAVLRTVRKSLDIHLVRDITVDVDRLSLPVWNWKLWDRRKHARISKSLGHNDEKRGSMGPPIGLPLKRARIN